MRPFYSAYSQMVWKNWQIADKVKGKCYAVVDSKHGTGNSSKYVISNWLSATSSSCYLAKRYSNS